MKTFTRISLAALLGLSLAAPALRADSAPAASTTPAASSAPAKSKKAKHVRKAGRKHHAKKAAAVTPTATDKK